MLLSKKAECWRSRRGAPAEGRTNTMPCFFGWALDRPEALPHRVINSSEIIDGLFLLQHRGTMSDNNH